MLCIKQCLNFFVPGLALEFANKFFTTWLKDLEKDMNSLVSNLKKAEIDGKLLVSFLFLIVPYESKS